MRNRLLLGFVLFAFIAMTLLVIPVGFTLNAHENASTLSALKRDTRALSSLLANDIGRNRLDQATKLSRSYSRTTGRQILVVLGATTLIATNSRLAADEELAQIARSVRTSPLTGIVPGTSTAGPRYYVAMPLPDDRTAVHSTEGDVVIVTFPVAVVTKIIHSNWRNLGLYGIMMLVLAAVFGFFISNSLTRPLRRIGTAVDAIGKGQLEVRAPVTTGPLELRQLAESINATSSRLIDLLEVQRSFVEDASHQLRTPLTALQLHLENLQYAEQRPTSEEFALVLAEVGRLNRLVESLLELARNESRNPVLDEVDLSDVAVGRVAFWRPLAVEHGLQLAATTRDKIRVFAIPGVLEQVVDNLLSNAFDATPAGGLIQVTVSKMGSTGVLHVIDTGPGLDATDRQLALRRFWRGRRSDVEGSGLGLAIVDQLLRLSGGSIELREAPGGGVDATVLLRLAP